VGLFIKKVLEYQKKKLVEAESNLQFHLTKKEQLKGITGSDKEIANEDKMIKIWSANIEKIKLEINKVREKK
jgi:hypothetical protein